MFNFTIGTTSIVKATSAFDEVLEKIYEAYDDLQYWGIMMLGGLPESETTPLARMVGRNITRAEVATLTTRMSVAEWFMLDSAVNIEDIFLDVGFRHWAVIYLSLAYEKGIVMGDGDGNFRPNDNITERETVTMIVRALGYSETARELGGFPYGYIQVAEELGLLEHTIMTLDSEREYLLRGNLFLLLYNAVQYRETLTNTNI